MIRVGLKSLLSKNDLSQRRPPSLKLPPSPGLRQDEMAGQAEFAEKVLFIRIPERGILIKVSTIRETGSDFAIGACGYAGLKVNSSENTGTGRAVNISFKQPIQVSCASERYSGSITLKT